MAQAGFSAQHGGMEITPLPKVATSTTDALIKSIGIPSRPGTLVDLQNEIARDDPDIRLIAGLVARWAQ